METYKWSVIISFFGMVALSLSVKYALEYVYSLYIFTNAVFILFLTIYMSQEFGFSNMKIGVCLLLVQLIAFPATWYGGHLTRKFDVLKLLGFTILLWGIAIFFLVVNLGMIGLAIILISGAMAVGNSQSYLRSQYSNIIQRSESGFQFGLFSVVSEAAVFIGPILYGYGSDYFKSQKIPLVILYITMVIGFISVWKAVKRIRRN